MPVTPVPGGVTAPASASTPAAAAAAGPRPEPCVLLKLGEIVLKGGNRHQFERMLQANLRRALHDVGDGFRFWHRAGSSWCAPRPVPRIRYWQTRSPNEPGT